MRAVKIIGVAWILCTLGLGRKTGAVFGWRAMASRSGIFYKKSWSFPSKYVWIQLLEANAHNTTSVLVDVSI